MVIYDVLFLTWHHKHIEYEAGKHDGEQSFTPWA